jgi:hypothetical protein
VQQRITSEQSNSSQGFQRARGFTVNKNDGSSTTSGDTRALSTRSRGGAGSSSNNIGNNNPSQNVTGGDSNRRTVDSDSSSRGGSFTRGARRATPTTKQVSEFLNLPNTGQQTPVNTGDAGDTSRVGRGRNQLDTSRIDRADSDAGAQQALRGRRGGQDNIGQIGKSNAEPADSLNTDNSGRRGRGGNRRGGNDDGQVAGVGINQNQNQTGANQISGDNTGRRRGRGGRGGNQLDNFDKDREFANWNIGRGRGGKGDHRDWSGKWKDSDRLVNANQIRNDWKHHHRDRDDIPFRGGWWGNHHHHHHHWDNFLWVHRNPFYWWSWTTAPLLTNWFTFGWPTPYYWDYGPGEYIYCHNGVVYVNGVWYAPAPVFYRDTVLLVDNVPDFTPEQAVAVQWMPLGVFAVTQDGVVDVNLLVQLAVTPEGVIGGTVLNQQTGVSYEAKGTVDKATQRAVWSYVDQTGNRVVMESSVFNLTQPQSTGLIHNSPNDIRVIELVRLEEPAGNGEVLPAGQPVDR